jgi:microcompartment protein CcmL/EutN
MNKALGLIETIGLIAAIEAADAAVKAANVILLGYENTKGSGKIMIKFVGDVGAVNAGVAAGVAAASRIGQVYGQRVIPRPHEEIDALIRNLDRGRGLGDEETVVEEETAVASAVLSTSSTTDAASALSADVTPPEPELALCAATTKSGEPCKLPAQPGSAYCFVHRKLAEDE